MISKFLKFLFRCKSGRCRGLCKCGGGTNVYTPSPPPQPTTDEAITSYIEGMPKMYEAQLEWAPKLAEQQMALTQQYMPALTALQQQLQSQYSPALAAQQWALQQQYGPLYAQQQQELQRQYEPEAYAAKQGLGGLTSQDYLTSAPYMQAGSQYSNALGSLYNDPNYLTNYSVQQSPGMDAARQRVIQTARGAWADRGLAESGMSAEDEARMVSEFEFPYALQQEQMTTSELGRRQSLAQSLGAQDIGTQENAYNRYMDELARRQNVALSLAGRYNVTSQPSVQTPTVATSNYQAPDLLSGYNIGNIMNAQQQGYSTYVGGSRPFQLNPLSLGPLGQWG